MTTKEQLLEFFKYLPREFISGEKIADELNLSRTAVWKAVNALKKDGYAIEAVRNRGYRLAELHDPLSVQGIAALLEPGVPVPQYVPSLPSTNAALREQAGLGAPEGTCILAGEQTRGRGRLGRSFYSPSDTGVYLSLLLRPEGFSPAQAVKVTTMAACAACEAISEISGREAGIKWVNDILLDGKKVCGILTEGSFDLETGSLDSIVLGIGINAYTPREGFPGELADIAGAVFPESQPEGRNRLAAAFLNRFWAIYRSGADHSEAYRSHSIALGKRITVISPTGQREALALITDQECRLMVQYSDGSIDTLSSAEISIRL